MILIERIYLLLEAKGHTAYKVSKDIGISNGYLSKTKKNEGNVSSNILEKIVNYYPDVNTRWLLTGKGEMLLSDTKTLTTSSETTLASLELDLKRKDFEMKGIHLKLEEALNDIELLKEFAAKNVQKQIDNSIKRQIEKLE